MPNALKYQNPVEPKHEGGAAGYVIGQAANQIEQSWLNFSSQQPNLERQFWKQKVFWVDVVAYFVLLVSVLDKTCLAKDLDMMK